MPVFLRISLRPNWKQCPGLIVFRLFFDMHITSYRPNWMEIVVILVVVVLFSYHSSSACWQSKIILSVWRYFRLKQCDLWRHPSGVRSCAEMSVCLPDFKIHKTKMESDTHSRESWKPDNRLISFSSFSFFFFFILTCYWLSCWNRILALERAAVSFKLSLTFPTFRAFGPLPHLAGSVPMCWQRRASLSTGRCFLGVSCWRETLSPLQASGSVP